MNKNKVVILTAAGTGIGADAAKQLASDGFNISILSSSLMVLIFPFYLLLAKERHWQKNLEALVLLVLISQMMI